MGARPANAVVFGARWLGLVLALAAGAVLRFEHLGRPSLWLDEMLGYELTTAAAARPWWAWLTGLEAEHGPLYYATGLFGRAFTGVEIEARIAAAIFGTATIVLIWLAASAIAGPSAGFCAALLLAISPLHVYYSREGRPYALTVFLAAALLLAIARAPRAVPWLVLAAVYTSATAIPLAIAATIAYAIRYRSLERGRAPSPLFAALPIAAALLLYRGERPTATDVAFPSLDDAFLDSIVRAFGVTAVGSGERGNTAIVIALLAVAGAIVLIRRRAFDVVALFALPIAIALAGLAMTQHWYAVRYVTPALPAYLVLIAVAIDAGVRFLTKRLPPRPEAWATPALIVIAAVLIGSQTVSASRVESHRKLNWRVIARTLWNHAAERDVVVTAEPWSNVSLRFYLDRLPKRVRVGPAGAPWRERAWFVTAGHSPSPAIRESLCRYPIVLASEIEDFRLHYAPSAHDFLRHRSGARERNAIRAAQSGTVTLDMSAADDLFLGQGWSQAEGSGRSAARWAIGTRAELIIPDGEAARHQLAIRVLPLSHRGLPPQVLSVSVNDAPAGQRTLQPEWNEVRFDVAWRKGINVVAFEFSRATPPSALDPSLTDARPLAALFDSIVAGPAHAGDSPLRTVRLLESGDWFLDEKSAWRDHDTRLDPREWNRDRVSRLIARLGFDPAVAMPRLLSGEVALEDLLASSALLRDCDGAEEFVRGFWQTVFEKKPNAIEERVLLSILKGSATRAEFARRIARMTEFRAILR